jgi:hypothetical protein
MNRKTIAVIFLLLLAILIVVPESFAYPSYGDDCSACHGNDVGNNNVPIPTPTPIPPPPLGNDIGHVHGHHHRSILSITDENNAQTDAQTGGTSGLMMDPIRYTLGIIGTALVVISQFYSIRKRTR